MLATWVKTHYTKSEYNNCFIIHSKYFPPQNMLNKKRYRITETSSEDKIDGRFGFTFKVKKCQVDKLLIFIYVNLSNWYFLVLNIASLKMTSKRRSNLSEILFTCFSIRKTCLTLCKNFFFKTFVIVWLFHFRPTYKIFRDFLQLYTTRTAKLVRRLSLCLLKSVQLASKLHKYRKKSSKFGQCLLVL